MTSIYYTQRLWTGLKVFWIFFKKGIDIWKIIWYTSKAPRERGSEKTPEVREIISKILKKVLTSNGQYDILDNRRTEGSLEPAVKEKSFKKNEKST